MRHNVAVKAALVFLAVFLAYVVIGLTIWVGVPEKYALGGWAALGLAFTIGERIYRARRQQ